VPNAEIDEVLGLVQGNSVRARAIGRDIVAGLRSLVGGEIREYAELMATARDEAIQRMVAQAEALGADAVVQVRLNTADVMQGAAELLAYGTAVRLKS
jgi:uncharacterized protein YbjQ (UPF0145 family)